VTVPALSRFERTLVRAMLAGVWISSILLTAGLGLLLFSRAASSSASDDLLLWGLVVLMATPVLRVLLSIAEAIRQRDWFWLWTTVAVAVILAGTVAYSLRALQTAT
jgi:uncharacterized membrane protein